jgi:hypothetical protein
MHALYRVMPEAKTRRHEPNVILRDGNETLFQCERCDVFGYLDSTEEQPIVGGELFDTDCTHEGPPRTTALTFLV